jgi:glycosyltransferase involved in cell wall biosynthesis
MTAPRVSVLVPVYDAGATLPRALDSVAAQTFRDHEVVVVDDGSTDAATRAALAAAAARPGVTVLRQENRGPAAARNVAARRARGDYLLPLDADDWLAPAFLARTVPLLDADPALDVVHTWVGLEGAHAGIWCTGPFAIPPLLSRCTVHVTSLVRRRTWERVGGWDETFREGAEDWEFWIAAAAGGARGACVPEVLCHYHRGGASRERGARTEERSRALARRLVAKHHLLYAAHVEEAFAGLYAEYARTADALERVYAVAPLRWWTRLRAHLRGGRA